MLIAALEIWLLLQLATNCCKDNNTLYHKAQRLLSVVLNLERGSSVTFTTHQLLPSSSLSSSLDAISHHHQPKQRRATMSIHHYYLLVTLGTCGNLQLLAKVVFLFFWVICARHGHMSKDNTNPVGILGSHPILPLAPYRLALPLYFACSRLGVGCPESCLNKSVGLSIRDKSHT